MAATEEALLADIYERFNRRDIDGVLSAFDPEVKWPNAMEGGIEHGHNAIRQYWTRQWKTFHPKVFPLSFETGDDGRMDVTVHQVVHDMNGKLLADQIIHHVYSFKHGLVTAMEIKLQPK